MCGRWVPECALFCDVRAALINVFSMLVINVCYAKVAKICACNNTFKYLGDMLSFESGGGHIC